MNPQDIENEINKIPGNGAVLEELYKLLESGEAISLVGAGASAGLWPLWNEFLQGFIGHSHKCGKINPKEEEFFQKKATQAPLETAQQIRNKIGEQLYFEYLQETFKDKISPDTGGAYTLTHKALMQLPIRNYLTLNYDAGLTNARAGLYPKATTSYFLWYHEESKRILDRQYKRQVLHAHGRHDLADSIILTLDDYRKAYDNPAFVRLLDHVFAYEKLLIVGFGMNDPYIKQLFNSISKDYKKSPLHHIAVVGLDDEDLQVTHLLREHVEMVYGARILFYPAKDNHKALTDWLMMFVEKYAMKTAEEIQPFPTPPQLKKVLPDKYVHQPTDDENFKGRALDFAILNRWGNDPGTRMIAVTGIGGQGKTALVGRWLKQERSPELAQAPVFYWSFYQDLDVEKFLKQVEEFCLPFALVYGIQASEPISFILSVVQKVRLMLVLDGLEVLQEEASKPAHGRINHPLLEQLLQQWVRYPHGGLMILTSRFRFPQLERYSGVGFHHLNLVRLSTEDGVALLKKLNVIGDQELLETYVEKLYGHPLALRVLASTVKRCCLSDLSQFKGDQILMVAGEDDKLTQKLKHLLGFYESQLKNGQKELLGIISLFKRPVEIKSFVTLLGKMKSLENTPLAKANESQIEKQLALLVDDFLVEKTREGITTHPVIRDYFREGLKITGSRREVADFLKARPGAERPQNIEEVRDLVEAVLLLCDEGEFRAAHDLFSSRLSEGGYGFNVFKSLPAVAEGLECHLAFVKDKIQGQNVEKVLGKGCVARHCSGVSLYNYYLGNLAQALEWRYKGVDLDKQQNKKIDPFDLHDISEIEIAMGNIKQAQETVSQALSLSNETMKLDDLSSEFARKGYYEFLLGNSSQAFQDFEIALYYEQKKRPNEQHLYSLEGNKQAEFFIRLQAWKKFEAVNSWNIQISDKNNWNDKLALCHLLQGWYEVCLGRLSKAENALAQAERILRPSGMAEYVCRLDRVWALLAEAKGEYEKGLHRANDALFTCADKGFRLRQADLMVLRGRLCLMQFQKENDASDVIASHAKRGEAIPDSDAQASRLLRRPDEGGTPRNDNLIDLLEKAGDDGDEALRIAEQTGYIWAKVEALELLASYHQTRASLPGFNSQDEKELAQRYAKEAASIKAGLFLTEKQMEELKVQARKEFEKQVAGWGGEI